MTDIPDIVGLPSHFQNCSQPYGQKNFYIKQQNNM